MSIENRKGLHLKIDREAEYSAFESFDDEWSAPVDRPSQTIGLRKGGGLCLSVADYSKEALPGSAAGRAASAVEGRAERPAPIVLPRVRSRTAMAPLAAVALLPPILMRLFPALGLYELPVGLAGWTFAASAISVMATMPFLAFLMIWMLEGQSPPPSPLRRLGDVCVRIGEVAAGRGGDQAALEGSLEACMRLAALSEGSLDHRVIEISARISNRLPELLDAYERVDRLATDQEAGFRLRLLEDGVASLGRDAENARLALLADATDTLDTQARYLRAAAGPDPLAGALSPVDDAAAPEPRPASNPRPRPVVEGRKNHQTRTGSWQIPY